MKLVGRFAPFHCSIDPLMKLLPVAVKKKPGPPAAAEFGLKLVSTGTGLPPLPVTVNTTVLELLAGLGSVVALAMLAVLEIDPATVGLTTIVMVALLPLKILTKLQVTVLVPEQDPMELP